MSEIMKKAQKGNEQAFLKLFQPYEEDIYRMAFMYVKNCVSDWHANKLKPSDNINVY